MLVQTALLVLVRRCLLKALLLECLRAWQLQILLLFLVNYFWEFIVMVVLSNALCVLMFHFGHFIRHQALVVAILQVVKPYEGLAELILMHAEMRK